MDDLPPTPPARPPPGLASPGGPNRATESGADRPTPGPPLPERVSLFERQGQREGRENKGAGGSSYIRASRHVMTYLLNQKIERGSGEKAARRTRGGCGVVRVPTTGRWLMENINRNQTSSKGAG